MTRRVVISIVVLLGLGLAGLWAAGRGPDDARPVTADAGPMPRTGAVDPPTLLATISRPAASAPLPPPGADPAEILPALRDRARAGDRRAACRLAAELLRCEAIGFRLLFDERNDASFQADFADRPEVLDATDKARIRRLQVKQACDRLPTDLRREGRHWLEAAARAGEPEAMIRYASGEQWGMMLGGFLGDPGFDRWRRDAPGMMHAAMRAGWPEAVFPLGGAYADDFGLLPGLVVDDPGRARAYQLLHQRLRGRADSARRPLDAAAEARARATAERWHQRHFGGRQFAADTVLLTPYGFADDDAEQTEFCREIP